MASQVNLHLGTHRTGTTSLQRFLADNRDGVVREAGYRYPVGMVHPESQIELGLASLRPARLQEVAPLSDRLLTELGHDARTVDPVWAERIRSDVASSSSDKLLYSCENLSWIRHPDELDSLLALFPGADITAVLFTRDPDDFLASYAAMSRFLISADNTDPDSVWNVGPATWLIDYEERIRLWRDALGADHLHVFSYEDCVRADGSTIPTVLDVLGIDREVIAGSSAYFLNGRPT